MNSEVTFREFFSFNRKRLRNYIRCDCAWGKMGKQWSLVLYLSKSDKTKYGSHIKSIHLQAINENQMFKYVGRDNQPLNLWIWRIQDSECYEDCST